MAVSGRKGLGALGWGVGVVGLLLAGWVARPWWHPTWMWLTVRWPVVVAVGLMLTSVLILTLRSRRFASEPEGQAPEPMRPLTTRAIVFGTILILGVAAAVTTFLLTKYADAGPGVQLDAIRTAGSIVVGTGGAAALLLAARRQRSTELTLAHQHQVAQATEYDATQRRITELYVKAVEQLGSEVAAVRHGSLYGLERVAQDNPEQRQAVVNVLCGYLRGHWWHTEEDPPARSFFEDREVRLTAQRILANHLHPGADRNAPVSTFWPGIDLDLSGATVFQFSLSGCHVSTATFNGTTFKEETSFAETVFAQNSQFSRALFEGAVSFDNAHFERDSWFDKATFRQHGTFIKTTFDGTAWFASGEFSREVEFRGAKFSLAGSFNDARFGGTTDFFGASFNEVSNFDGARFSSEARFSSATFQGDAWFNETGFDGDARFIKAEFRADAGFQRARFGRVIDFETASFQGRALFQGVELSGDALLDGTNFTHGVPVELQPYMPIG